jgi:Zn-dependent protease with chaperone function
MIPSWMLYSVTLALLLGLAAASLETVVRQRDWPVRWLWVSALFGSVVLPVLAIVRPHREPSISATPLPALPAPSVSGGPIWRDGLESARSFPATVSAFDPGPWLVGAWALASAVVLVGLVIFQLVLWRRRREWVAGEVDGRRVWISCDTGPAVVGFIRSRIVLPEWLLELGRDERALVLAHEEEHIRARDPGLLLGALLALAVLPWNLPLWWQYRRLRQAVEVDCDRRVLHGGLDARTYSRLLVAIGARGAPRRLAVVTLSDSSSALERRIRAMLSPRPLRWWPRFVGSSALAGMLVLAACVVDRPPDPPTTSTEQAFPTPRTVDGGTGAWPNPGGGGGGGFAIPVRDAWVAFAVQERADTGWVGVLVVGRVSRRSWPRLTPPDRPARLPHLAGSAMGRIRYGLDLAGNFWIDEQTLPLGVDNVVLVDRADGRGGDPIVVGTLRIDPVYLLPGSDFRERSQAKVEQLWERLESRSEVRSFLGLDR